MAETSPTAERADAPTWYWRLDFPRLKEAAAIRRRDPNEFRQAPLTFFGLGGRDDGPIIERMRAHPQGSRILRERVPLPAGVLDPARYAELPENTLGRRYYEHCKQHGLDPTFISTESEKVAREFPSTEEHQFVYERHRDSHDFWHVLTGWGTDMAGEAGIIAWTYAQVRNKGYLAIFLLNAFMCTKRGRPDVWLTCWKGYRQGARDPLLLAVDWHEFMERPIDEVRRELGMQPSPRYRPFEIPDAPGAPPEPPAPGSA